MAATRIGAAPSSSPAGVRMEAVHAPRLGKAAALAVRESRHGGVQLPLSQAGAEPRAHGSGESAPAPETRPALLLRRVLPRA